MSKRGEAIERHEGARRHSPAKPVIRASGCILLVVVSAVSTGCLNPLGADGFCPWYISDSGPQLQVGQTLEISVVRVGFGCRDVSESGVTVDWSTSDASIVQVSRSTRQRPPYNLAGVVTGVSPGQAILAASLHVPEEGTVRAKPVTVTVAP
jgi:hypothetical protein